MENKICSKCGAEMPSEAKFCTKCGQSFEKAAPKNHTNKQKLNKKSLYALLAVFGILFLIIFGAMYYSEYSERREARIAREKFVQDSIKRAEIAAEKERIKIKKEEEIQARKDFILAFYKGLMKSEYDYSYIKKFVTPKALQVLKDEYDFECEDGDCLAVWLFAYRPGTDQDYSNVVSYKIFEQESNDYMVLICYNDSYYGEIRYSVTLTITKVGETYKIDNIKNWSI